MITATIQSMSLQGTSLVVIVLLSNGNTLTYNFGASDTMDTITQQIQSDVDNMNSILNIISSTSTTLVNMVVSPTLIAQPPSI